MGFLDNFKAAMQRGVDAANANIERQRAEQAAAAGAARPQPQAKPQPRTGHKLPEGVVMASLQDIGPIDLGTDSKGQNVVMNISGTILAKPMGQSTLDPNAQREEIKRIARESLSREMAPQIESMGDLKFMLTFANRMNRVVCEDLKAYGYEAAFRIPLMITPKR
ncbi:MAG: hypothetical protein J6Y58_08195 [Clostridiales bacterium]|nr:hypothetical protein [Clostridiales bacterium]